VVFSRWIHTRLKGKDDLALDDDAEPSVSPSVGVVEA
jgi:hypothetical protein